ncbi:glycosyl hydrolase [Niveomyces insectorum RCEF 264]|uniref:Glycosyl hydrolase n=1 Tax=Niveomyces insectorum RCEF 264 TaxID=1081102 RepID=A0A167QAG9_9HYPO|nr:glycosyl hydrolase [Niveomyces insectorum RCEF 264]
MFLTSVLCVVAATSAAWASPVASTKRAACKGNKAIDNFSSWANKTNSLGAVSGDDKTMAAISVSNSTISLTPKAGAYFYENLPCEDAAADGYRALSFKLGGPPEASFLIELQTKASCNATTHTSTYHNVSVPAGTTPGTVTVPLADFTNATLSAVSSFTFSTFNRTDGAYTLSDLELVCGK